MLEAGLRIRIRRIRMFLGIMDSDPDPLVRGMYPDFYCFVTFFYFLSLKNDVKNLP